LLFLLFANSLEAAPSDTEYRLKAALIYKLTKFIEWPVLPRGQKLDTFGVCLLGEDQFGDALDSLSKRSVKNAPIEIYRHAQSEAIDSHCQIVYISSSKRGFIDSILQSLRGRPILSLSDLDEFAEQGGILQFTTGKQRIGFTINMENARQAKLTIAAPLLDLATLIDEPAVNKAIK
jgi:hypothetical protein